MSFLFNFIFNIYYTLKKCQIIRRNNILNASNLKISIPKVERINDALSVCVKCSYDLYSPTNTRDSRCFFYENAVRMYTWREQIIFRYSPVFPLNHRRVTNVFHEIPFSLYYAIKLVIVIISLLPRFIRCYGFVFIRKF